MPNHVHVVVQPLPGFELEKIVHSWKSFTANRANKILNRQGSFWQVEYYDHMVRDEGDLDHAVNYAWSNPENAGLSDWRWRWKIDEWIQDIRITGFQGEPSKVEREKEHGLEARGTSAFAYLKSRLGVVKEKTLQLGSPFDYSRQATLFVESDLPEPG